LKTYSSAHIAAKYFLIFSAINEKYIYGCLVKTPNNGGREHRQAKKFKIIENGEYYGR